MQKFKKGDRVEVFSRGQWRPATYCLRVGNWHAVRRADGEKGGGAGGEWLGADAHVRPLSARTSAERKGQPIATGVLAYFPKTLAALSEVSRRGNDKHNPGEPLHHDPDKSTDEADCCLRHIVDALEADKRGDAGGVFALNEDGSPHLIAALWRLAMWSERALNGDERWRTVAKP